MKSYETAANGQAENSEAEMRGDQNISEGTETNKITFIHLSFRKTGIKKTRNLWKIFGRNLHKQ